MYDFDKTLCTKDMQDYGFIPSLEIQPNEFWHRTNIFGTGAEMDGVLAYLYTMIEECKRKGIPLTREKLVNDGKLLAARESFEYNILERTDYSGRE